jgi:hypothetical protein
MDTIDHRTQSFVAWHGEVPPEAKRVQDFEAREHAAMWIRRNIGKGVAGAHVIGYESGSSWWSLFFDRVDTFAPRGAEVWHVESYSHSGRSWSGRFYYWPAENRWRHVLYQRNGDDYGRHRAP